MEEKRPTDLSDNDEDSGNDEPPYNVGASASTNRNDRDIDVSANEDDSSRPNSPADLNEAAVLVHPKDDDRIANKENVFLGDRPDPNPPRNLRQYLSILSEPRDDGNVADAAANNERRLRANALGGKDIANICALPVEVLLTIFSYLDDLSLCNVGEVCKQWRKILEVHTPQTMWEKYTKQRWPLYQQIAKVSNWFNVI